jgi:amino-acid N-acetyltransferase
MKSISLEGAQPGDWHEVSALVSSSGLPLEGLSESLETALVARLERTVVGVVALEIYGRDALLRSLVVAPGLRGEGLGERLARAALDLARRRGVTGIYLLTETAAAFFRRRGFVNVERSDVPQTVRESVEFRSACPSTAEVLALSLLESTEAPENRRM